MNSELKPKIRFKGFTDDWEQRKLGSIGYTFTGLSGKTKDDFGHGQARFVTYMNVFSNPIATMDKTELVEIDHKQNEVQYGDIFFTTSSETPEEVGMSSVWLENTTNIYLNSFCFGFRPIEKNNPYYMAYMFRAKNFRSKMILLAQGISRYNISKNSAMDIEIKLPKSKEQESIGKLFYKIDNLITLHQRKCDKLVELKKSLLEKMFPQNNSVIPEIRFKGFADDWEQRKFTEFVEFFKGQTYSPNDVRENGTLILRSSNVQNGEVTRDDNVYISNKVVNVSNVKIGDVIVVVRNGSRALIGKHAKIKEKMPNTVIGAFMTGIRSKNSEFINSLLNTSIFEQEIEKNMGATINQITGYMFANMNFKIPKDDEQKTIGRLFDNLDNLITLHQRKHDKLNKIKQSLLNDMFV